MRYLFIVALLLTSAVAQAADDKKVDFTVVLTDDGQNIPDPVQCNAKPAPCVAYLTLGGAAYYALRSPEPGLSWDENIRRADLAAAVRDSKSYSVLPADLDLIRKQMAKIYGPGLIHAAAKALEAK